MAKKSGRPTKYNEELAAEIISRLAREPIAVVFADPKLPDRQTYYNWLLEHQTFFDSAARARAIAALRELDEAEDNLREEGDKKPDASNIPLLRERLQHQRWKVSKLLPKSYGDKLAVEALSVDVSNLTDAQLARLADGEDLRAVLKDA